MIVALTDLEQFVRCPISEHPGVDQRDRIDAALIQVAEFEIQRYFATDHSQKYNVYSRIQFACNITRKSPAATLLRYRKIAANITRFCQSIPISRKTQVTLIA